jgi:hypothetical protein
MSSPTFGNSFAVRPKAKNALSEGTCLSTTLLGGKPKHSKSWVRQTLRWSCPSYPGYRVQNQASSSHFQFPDVFLLVSRQPNSCLTANSSYMDPVGILSADKPDQPTQQGLMSARPPQSDSTAASKALKHDGKKFVPLSFWHIKGRKLAAFTDLSRAKIPFSPFTLPWRQITRLAAVIRRK